MLGSTGHDTHTNVGLAARSITGADLFGLGRQVETSSTQLVVAVLALIIVGRDVASLAQSRAGTAGVAERQAHPGELAIFADVAALPVHLLWGDRGVV